MSLKDILATIGHAEKHTTDITDDMLNHESVTGGRHAAVQKRANTFVQTNAAGEVETIRGAKADIIQEIESLKDYRTQLEDYKSQGWGSTRMDSKLERELEQKVTKGGRGAMTNLGNAAAQEQRALDLLREQQSTVEKALDRQVSNAGNALQKAVEADKTLTTLEMRGDALRAGRQRIMDRAAEAKNKIIGRFEDQAAIHNERLTSMDQLADDIVKESGGKFNKADFFKKAGSAESKLGSAEVKAVEEAGMKLGKLKLGFNMNTALAAVSVGAIYDGAKRLMSGFKGGVNEKGEQTPPDTSQQVIGAVEAGGAAFALHKLVTQGGLFKAASHVL